MIVLDSMILTMKDTLNLLKFSGSLEKVSIADLKYV